MDGAKNTPYEGGFFKLNAIFPFDYPNHGPVIKFITIIYHACVDNKHYLGRIDLNRLNAWRSTGRVHGYDFIQ